MIATPSYDPGLSADIRTELNALTSTAPEQPSEVAALISRIEGKLRHLFPDAVRLEGTIAFLKGAQGSVFRPSSASEGPEGPVRRSMSELAALSGRLDSTTDPSTGFTLAQGVARRAHEIARTVDGLLAALDPKEAITGAFHRLMALLSRLIQNAVARIREFGRRIGVSSFSLAFASDPPCVTATFTFGNG
jgi:hypothetical protein